MRKYSIYVKGGGNLSAHRGETESHQTKGYIEGFQVSTGLDFPLSNQFAINPELTMIQAGAKLDIDHLFLNQTTIISRQKLWYINSSDYNVLR